MSVNNQTIIASATGASTKTVTIEETANIYLTDAADIAANTIPLDLVDDDGATGGQAEFNGTTYQLDASNNIIHVQGPAVIRIVKGVTTNAVGVAAYSTGGLTIV